MERNSGLYARGGIIIIPFLLRNILISGYLLYPYAGIDLFSVDWKMSKAIVVSDAKEIIYWGRNMQGSGIKDPSFKQWFPQWFLSIGIIYEILMVINLTMIPGGIIWGMIEGIRHKKWERMVIQLASIVCFCGWFFSAPLVRYGKAWLLVGGLLPIAHIAQKIGMKIYNKNSKCYLRLAYIGIVLVFGLSFMKGMKFCYMMVEDTFSGKRFNYWIKQADYKEMNSEAFSWNGITFYEIESGVTGYHDFPVAEKRILAQLELRGNGIQDGFKLKDRK